MGYFSNGSEGAWYQSKYCSNCANDTEESPCQIWGLHLLYNYADCNNKDSLLHQLIPRIKDDVGNGKCTMFCPTNPDEIKPNIPLKGEIMHFPNKVRSV